MKQRVQRLIEALSNDGLKLFAEERFLKVTRHGKYPNLVMLNYDQIKSPMADPLVQICRGIILDQDSAWDVVSFPYAKFFNYNETLAAKIDWASAKVYEKLDGSLMTLYWYDGGWQVASSGTPDASGNVGKLDRTFADLFWKTFESHIGVHCLPEESVDACFMLELMTPENRIIVPHKASEIYLHGVRELVGFRELDPTTIADCYGIPIVPQIQALRCSDLDRIKDKAATLNPMENEGYVVCDKDYNRIKIKSPKYVALSRLLSGYMPRRVIQVLLDGEADEFLSYFPEFHGDFSDTRARISQMIGAVYGQMALLEGIDDRKEFALLAQKTPLSHFLFEWRFKDIKPMDTLRKMPAKKIEEMLPEGIR